MWIVRPLLVLLALATSAFAQDAPRDVAAAREAAQAFQAYVEEVAKKGERPDLTRPEVARLLRRVFDLDALAALPAAQGNDILWLVEWGATANSTYKLITRFGSKSDPDWAAIQRNMTEYEDEVAAALNFQIRFQARQAVSMDLFFASLAPEQRTPVREKGLTGARSNSAEYILSAIGAVVIRGDGKPANARLVAAAIRDTREVWASFFLPQDRARLVKLLAALTKRVPDETARTDIATFAAALEAMN